MALFIEQNVTLSTYSDWGGQLKHFAQKLEWHFSHFKATLRKWSTFYFRPTELNDIVIERNRRTYVHMYAYM
jgi:uncharacterized protein with von Willebrand factor type A (vWA) domain